MRCSTAFVVAALAALSQAVQFDFGPGSFAPIEGKAVVLNWSDATGPVTITLKNGPSDDLKTIEIITSENSSGSFTWVPDNLPSDTYALEIDDGTEKNYSPQFVYSGTGTVSATPSATSATVISTSESTISTSSMSSTMSSNMTTSATTMSTTTSSSTRTTSSTAAATTDVVNQNGSSRLGASLAVVFGAAAIFSLFN